MKAFALMVAVLLLSLSACNKEKAPETPAPTAPATDTAKAPEAPKPAEPPKTDQPAPVAAAPAGDAPEFLKKSIDHLKAINALVKDNMADCGKTVAAVEKYMEEHKADLEAINKASQEMMTKASDEDKAKMAQQAMGLMMPVMQELTEVQTAFAQKCQKEVAKLSEAMGKFSPKGK
jgi:hypothetical protein